MNCRFQQLALRATFLGVFILSCASRESPAADSPQAGRVVVESGAIAGVPSGGVIAYKSIPYAAPPVGDLRWRPPSAPLPWPGVRQALDYGPSCPQAAPPERVPAGSRAQETSEDCLTLNVWTPAVHPKPLPVMVWLHGGGNISGTAAQTFYDGSAFARDGVVLVTLNYRLGLLGFFAPAAIAGEAGGAPTGNFGLLDQVAALRWVRSNVAAFGGDPSRVTLFGESAGGQDALILAASDAARGLFARAIVESAGDVWARSPTLAQAQRRSADILAKLGLPRDAAAERLRAVPSATFANAGDDDQLGPIVDGAVVRAPLTETLARAVRVPIVIGTNDGEGSLLVDTTDLAAVFPQLSNDDIRVLLARYRSAGIDADAAASDLFGDAYFAAPARWVAETAAAAKQPAYLYRFDYIASIFTGRRHAATHGSEIPYVFESWPPGVPLSETDRQLERALHDCWVAFARDGVPACAAAPEWTRYDARVRRVMVFDARPSMREPGNADVLDRLQRKLLPN